MLMQFFKKASKAAWIVPTAILLSSLVASSLASCKLFNRSGGDPVEEKLAFTSFAVMPCDSSDGDYLEFNWTVTGKASSFKLYMSSTDDYATTDLVLTSYALAGSESRYTVKLSALPDPSPKNYRWFQIVACDESGAQVLSHTSLDFGVTGDPIHPNPAGALIDRAFWGRWLRLDSDEEWYVGDRSVSISRNGATLYSVDAGAATSAATLVLDPYYSVKVKSSELLEATITASYNNGDVFLLYRSGASTVGFSGTVRENFSSPAGSRAARALGSSRSLGPAASVSLVLQNAFNASDTLYATTDRYGVFSIEGAIPDSEYEITPLLAVSEGSATPVDSVAKATADAVSVHPLLEDENVGTVMVTDTGYQYKVSLAYSPQEGYGGYNWFLVADGTTRYSLTMNITNSGKKAAIGPVFTLKARDGGIEFYESSSSGYKSEISIQASSIEAGATLAQTVGIRIPASSSFSGAEYLDTAIDILIKDIVFQGGDWKDSVPLRVYHNETVDLAFTSWSGDAYYVPSSIPMSVISPEGLLIQPRQWGDSSVRLPTRREAGVSYRVVVSGAGLESLLKYSICAGSKPEALDENSVVSVLVDNTPDNPQRFYANLPFTALLTKGKNAFLEFVCAPPPDIGDLAPADPFGSSLSLSWTAADSQCFIITRSLADGSGATTLKSIADAWTARSFTDTSAEIGRAYLYTIQGYHENMGYTKPVTVPSYLAPYTKDAFALGTRPAFWCGGSCETLAVDSAAGILWALCHPAALDGVAQSAYIAKLSIQTGLPLSPTYALSDSTSYFSAADIDSKTGDLWLFNGSYSAPKVYHLALASGTWTSVDLAGLVAGGDLCSTFCYDSERGWLWFARLYLNEVLAIDAAASAPASADIKHTITGIKNPRSLAAASNGRLFVSSASGTFGNSGAFSVVPVAADFSLGSAWDTMPLGTNDSSDCDFACFDWDDTAGALVYAIVKGGSPFKAGVRDGSGASLVADLDTDALNDFAYRVGGKVGGEWLLYAGGAAIHEFRLSDQAILAFPAESGTSASHLFPEADGAFSTYDGENIIYWKADGSFDRAFSISVVRGSRWKPVNLDPPLARVESAGSVQWMLEQYSDTSTNASGVWRLDDHGRGTQSRVITFANYSSHLRPIRGGSSLFGAIGGAKLYAYDSGGAQVASTSSYSDSGSLGLAYDGSLIEAKESYAGYNSPTVLPWKPTIVSYAINGTAIEASSSATLDLSAIAGLARKPTDLDEEYTLLYDQPSLWRGQPYRDSRGHYWISLAGSWSYQARSSGAIPYQVGVPYAFLVEADASGALCGFIGGAEADYGSLGAALDDYCLLPDGRLLVLRDGAIERYTQRLER